MDPRGLTLKQLRAFAATVERGSVTGAALALHVTPPAISVQLKILEEQIGAPLFNRDVSPFAPTQVGAQVLALAHDVEKQIRRANERIDALKSGAVGSLVFGVVSTGKYLTPSLVAAFGREHPNIRVTLTVGNREEIIRGLERNEYDLTMMGRPPAHVPTESVVLGDHPHVLIAPPDHRLAGRPEILAEDLLPERFLAREPGSGTRTLMERFLERAGGGRPFDIVEMGTNETIKQSVMAGLGLAIISGHTCLSEIADRRLTTLAAPGLPLVRQWHLLNRSDRAPSLAALRFKAFILEQRAAFIPRV